MRAKILAGVGVVLLGFLSYVAFQPKDFKVTRSAKMNASAAAVFEQINDFHKWEAWSPWAKLDPKAATQYEGPASGVGAMFSWSGNSEVGVGKMTILESRPSDLIRLKLEFFKPFADVSTTEFMIQPEGTGVNLSWTMSGERNFMAKLIGVFMDCEKMVGPDFEKGLASIKALVEAKHP